MILFRDLNYTFYTVELKSSVQTYFREQLNYWDIGLQGVLAVKCLYLEINP